LAIGSICMIISFKFGHELYHLYRHWHW
jgi:hypothetical protein